MIPLAEPSPSQAPATTTAASTPTAIPKVTAACPLLSLGELKAFVGVSTSDTRIVTASESPPKMYSGYTGYICDYANKDFVAFRLAVIAVPEDQTTPQRFIDAIGKASKVSTHPVTGVGDAAVFYTLPDGVSVLAAAKRSQGEIRSVVLAGPVNPDHGGWPSMIPEHDFADATILVIGRL